MYLNEFFFRFFKQLFRPIDVIKVRGGEFLYMLGFQDENEEIKNLYFTSEDPHGIIWETFVAFSISPLANACAAVARRSFVGSSESADL